MGMPPRISRRAQFQRPALTSPTAAADDLVEKGVDKLGGVEGDEVLGLLP